MEVWGRLWEAASIRSLATKIRSSGLYPEHLKRKAMNQSASEKVRATANAKYEVLTAVLITYILTYSMEQSPSWEADWFSASKEIPRNLRNAKVHYRIH